MIMMARNLTLFVCSLCIGLFVAVPATAGKLSGEKIKQGMSYKITECNRPKPIKIKALTLEDYNKASQLYEDYAQAQQGFADCVEREAGGDLQALQDIIFAGGQDAIARSQRDIDALRLKLEQLRTKLDEKTQ